MCCRQTDDIAKEPVWMNRNVMMKPFSKKYFSTDFVEHIARRKVLPLMIHGIECHEEHKAEQTWQLCNEIKQTIECGPEDRLKVPGDNAAGSVN